MSNTAPADVAVSSKAVCQAGKSGTVLWCRTASLHCTARWESLSASSALDTGR
jgi:hypothetical protein